MRTRTGTGGGRGRPRRAGSNVCYFATDSTRSAWGRSDGAKNPHPQLSRAARLTRHHSERTVGAIELGNGLRWLEAMGCGNGHPLTGQQRPLATG